MTFRTEDPYVLLEVIVANWVHQQMTWKESKRDRKGDIGRNHLVRVYRTDALFLAVVAVDLIILRYDALWSHPLMMVLPTICVVVLGVYRSYLSIRYSQLPAWRWIWRGGKGEGDTGWPPCGERLVELQARRFRNRKQRICCWVGRMLILLGAVVIVVYFIFDTVYRKTGDRDRWLVSVLVLLGALTGLTIGTALVARSLPQRMRNHDGPSEPV